MKTSCIEAHHKNVRGGVDRKYVVKVELASAELAQLQRRSKSYSCVEAFYIPGSNKQLPEGDITYVVDLSRPMEPHLVTLYPKACAALEITTGTAAAKYVHNEIKKYLR